MRASPSAYPTLSQKTKSPSHLVLRNGTWHFRMAVPGPCRPRLGGLREFKASLKTGILREAKLLAGKLAANAHLVYLHAQNYSSQLEKRDKTATRALVRKWLLDGLDFYEPEHLSCVSLLSAEVRATHQANFEDTSVSDKQLLSPGQPSCISEKKVGKHFDREQFSYDVSSCSQLCWSDEAVSEIGYSNVSNAVEAKISDAKIVEYLIYDFLDKYLEESLYDVFEFVGGGVLDYQELRAQLAQWLAELLEKPDKKTISQKVIRERLNGYLRALLEKDDIQIQPRKGVSGPGIDLTSGQLSACYANMLTRLVDNPESLVDSAVDCIPHLIDEGVFKPEEISAENILQIAKAHIKIQVTNHKVQAARANGDYLTEQAIFAASYEPYPPNPDSAIEGQVQDTSINQFTLLELIEKYIETKLSDGAWKSHSVADHKLRLVNLVEILENKIVSDISRDDMRRFRDALRRLPPNRTKLKAYRGKSIKEILEMNPAEVLSVKTVNMIVEAASSMFDWGLREGYLSQNPAKGLSIKDDRQEIGLRDAFSPEDIRKIFASDHYVKGDFKHPSFFWAPLIAVYTGMRLEEVCQLSLDDIYESEQGGVWVIDVNANPYRDGTGRKLLKNKNAARIIPIHQDLIQVGLLDYRDCLKKKGVERLFSELNKTASSPKFGKQPGKSFAKLVRALDLGGNKTFHSLRHSFSDFFKVKGLHNDTFRQIFGHEIPELAGRQYGSKFDVRTCYEEVVSKLDYGIDVSLVNAKPYL